MIAPHLRNQAQGYTKENNSKRKAICLSCMET